MPARRSSPHKRQVAAAPAASLSALPIAERNERLRRVATMSELKAIMLKELSAVREDVVEQPNSRAENQMNVGFATRDRNLFVTVRFRFTTEPAAYSVSATFNLQYVLSADPDPKDAEVFAQTNAVFNAWPFWRELVQNTAIRLGFPAPTVPLLKI